MKTALLLILSLSIFLVGCATLEQGAYKVVGTTAIVVDTAMNAWGDYVRAGKATDVQQQQVRSLYENYQVSMRIAKTTILTLKNAPADQATWLRVTTALDVSANNLVVFIGKFIPAVQSR
jgi:hypothetical protein